MRSALLFALIHAVFAVWLPSTGATADLPEWVPAFYKRPLLAWPWFAPLGAGTTVAVALLANRLTSRR